ncbi:hypothetical protein STEG23_001003 [Scotinomys teguina]
MACLSLSVGPVACDSQNQIVSRFSHNLEFLSFSPRLKYEGKERLDIHSWVNKPELASPHQKMKGSPRYMNISKIRAMKMIHINPSYKNPPEQLYSDNQLKVQYLI